MKRYLGLSCMRRGRCSRAGTSRGAGARAAFDRGVRPAVARRLPAAGDQGSRSSTTQNGLDIKFVERHAGRLCGAVQLRRVPGRRQRRGADRRARRHRAASRSTYLFNLFDYLGHGGDLAGPTIKTLKDLEGKQLAAAKGTTNYVDVRLVREAAGRRSAKFSGGEYRDARPGRLRAGRPRRRGAAVGAGLYRC